MTVTTPLASTPAKRAVKFDTPPFWSEAENAPELSTMPTVRFDNVHSASRSGSSDPSARVRYTSNWAGSAPLGEV